MADDGVVQSPRLKRTIRSPLVAISYPEGVIDPDSNVELMCR